MSHIKWETKTAAEIAAVLATRNKFIVQFACRKGAVERMPKTPMDVRRPRATLAPLVRAYVEKIDGQRVYITDTHSHGGWVDIADGLFYFDPL